MTLSFSFDKRNDVGVVFGANVALSVIVKGNQAVHFAKLFFGGRWGIIVNDYFNQPIV